MKFGQYNKNITREKIFFKNYAENETGRLVPELSLLSGLQDSIHFDSPHLGIQWKQTI